MGVLVCAVALLGIVSAWAGAHAAVFRSQDFQWSGERLLLRHVDPWQVYLTGNPGHALIGTQVPNYLPVLYVLLVPFGLLPMAIANSAWACCNVLFSVGSAVLAARFFGLRGVGWAMVVAGILLAANPTRTSISNGQQGLFVLALWSVALLWPVAAERSASRPGIGGLLLVGVSYLKYSFAPAVALYLLLRNGLRTGVRRLLWTALPALVSTVLVWLWIDQPHDVPHLLRQAVAPLQVAKAGYQPTADPGQTMMDLLEFLLGGHLVATPRLTAISFAVAIAITAGVLLGALRHLRRAGLAHSADGRGWLLALVATMSFVLYKHHPYDEVVFLYPLCYALRRWQRWPAAVVLVLIGYSWFVQRFVDPHFTWTFLWAEVRLAMLFVLLGMVYGARPLRAVPAAPDAVPLPDAAGLAR